MASRALPVGLLLVTLVMDGQGRHQTALYVLLLALAAAVGGALSVFGELVELPGRAPGVGARRHMYRVECDRLVRVRRDPRTHMPGRTSAKG